MVGFPENLDSRAACDSRAAAGLNYNYNQYYPILKHYPILYTLYNIQLIFHSIPLSVSPMFAVEIPVYQRVSLEKKHLSPSHRRERRERETV